MREDKFVFRLALFERPLEPLILRIAEREPHQSRSLLPAWPPLSPPPSCLKAIVHLRGRMPVIVQHHKQRVAPRPGVIILQQPDGFQRRGIAAVKTIRRGRGIKAVAGVLCENRDVVANVGLVEIEQRRLFVIAVEQEKRRGLRDQSQERTLQGVAFGDCVRIDFWSVSTLKSSPMQM